MFDIAAQRRAQQIQFAKSRLAERSDASIERSDASIERSDASIERSDASIERSDASIERGGGSRGCRANDVAAEIFRNAASLGGHMVVAFITPVSASNSRPRVASNGGRSWSQAEAVAAAAVVELLIDQRRPVVKQPVLPVATPAPRMKS